ncbi:MAG: helix-turn-helix transcriptional regulator [Amphritea sp.]
MDKIKLASRKWYQAMGQATELLGKPGFPDAMMAALSRVINYDGAAILLYPPEGVPIMYHESDLTGGISERGEMKYYLRGMYLLDPFYLKSGVVTEGGLWMLKEVAPDHFTRTEYYRRYFVCCNYQDEANYILPIPGQGSVAIALDCCRRISRAEVDRLRAIEPWVLSLMKIHWNLSNDQPQPSTDSVGLAKRLAASFDNFGISILTDRECQVAQLMLRGHSTKSSANKLGISSETVKVHRRNLYQKLDIQSQPELFSLFLDALSVQDEESVNEDPLERYLGPQTK